MPRYNPPPNWPTPPPGWTPPNVGEGLESDLPFPTALDLERLDVIVVIKVDDVGAPVGADCVHKEVALSAVGVVGVDGVVVTAAAPSEAAAQGGEE